MYKITEGDYIQSDNLIVNRLVSQKVSYPELNIIGELFDSNIKTVGVVGSRKMTPYGKRVCETIVGDLAAAGVAIISGLMYGIDLCAHEAALSAGGRTIAVLGYGLNHLDTFWYTKNTKAHAQTHPNNQAIIISQFQNDFPPQKWTFRTRNKLIAELSDILLVVEAGQNSGSLITANHALDLGKEVFAVPGSIFSSQSIGTNLLIYEGATICQSSAPILNSLKINPKIKSKTQKLALDDLSHKLLDFIELNSETDFPATVDAIFDALSAYENQQISEALINLELLGLVEKDIADRYTIRP